MAFPKSIQNNLRFLLAEVGAQLTLLHTYFEYEPRSVAQRILDRSGYAYNLRIRIQNGCMLHINQNEPKTNNVLRAVSLIAGDLERIVELCRDCIQQSGYLSEKHKIDLTVYLPLVNMVSKGVDMIAEALFDNNSQLALKLSRSENKLDKSYQKLLKKHTKDLKSKRYTADLVTSLFVAHNIEQMGDLLLKISESILSSNLGQPIDMQRFQSLQETISVWKDEQSIEQVEIKPVAETRSGSGISSVNYQSANKPPQLAIYKDGEKKKLKEELDGLEAWNKNYPGITPDVITYKKTGKTAALLIEHLQGDTFESLVINASQQELTKAMNSLEETLHATWDKTQQAQPVNAKHMQQLRKRLADVYSVHPEFKKSGQSVCGQYSHSFEKLIEQSEKIEDRLNAPFNMFIHGDFNVDNVIFEPDAKQIYFIDVHRSKHFDYVQDVSVFMISNYRLQVFDTKVRKKIAYQISRMYEIGRIYARKRGDDTFDARLAFGLARSLLTSTRFILDKSMSKKMALLAKYILVKINQTDTKKLGKFKLPIKEIFDE